MQHIHVLSWNTLDSWKDKRNFIVEAFGQQVSDTSTHGNMVHIQMEDFQPFLRLKIARNTTREDVNVFFSRLCRSTKGMDSKFTFESQFPLYPYNEFHDRFVRLTFNSEYSRKKTTDLIRNWLREKNYSVLLPCMQLYDAALPSLLAMQHERNLPPSGHIGVPSDRIRVDSNGTWRVSYKDVVRIEDDRIAPFKIASFDIETLSHESYTTNGYVFPDSNKALDTINQIGTCVMTVGSDEIQRVVFVLDTDRTMFRMDETEIRIKDEEHSDFLLYSFYTEGELLLGWSRFIKRIDPDMFIGYNIFGFDWSYIHQRCLFCKIEKEFCQNLSRTDQFERMYRVVN